MGRRAACVIACGLIESFVVACATGPLDPDTALRLARDQQQTLAAAWASDNDMVNARAGYEVERASPVDLASASPYPKGRFMGARLMRKLDRQDSLLRLAKNEYIPAFSLAAGHIVVEYQLRAENANAKYDGAARRVTIRVATPVVERFEGFVERGDGIAVAKLEIGFRPTDAGAQLLKALDELRKEDRVERDRLYSPGDDILVQLLAVEENMKRRETRFVRYERTDAGWQVAKPQ